MVDADHAGRGVYIATEEKGIWAIASIAAEYDEYDKSLIACATADMATAIFQTIEKIDKGTYIAGFELMGVKQGIVDFTFNPILEKQIPEAVKKKLTELKIKLSSNEIDVIKLVTSQ